MALERRCSANEQYSRRESVEILGISANVGDNGLESKVLETLEETEVLNGPSLVEECHRLHSLQR